MIARLTASLGLLPLLTAALLAFAGAPADPEPASAAPPDEPVAEQPAVEWDAEEWLGRTSGVVGDSYDLMPYESE